MSLLDIPEDLREECRRADIDAKSLLLEVARLKDPDEDARGDRARRGGLHPRRSPRREEGGVGGARPREAVLVRLPAQGGNYKLALSFAKSRVEKAELVSALKEVIKQLEAGEIKLPKR